MATKNTIDITDATFDNEVKDHKGYVLVDFWADWCGPCKALSPVLEEFAGDRKHDLKVAKVDVSDENTKLLSANIRSIPTLILFKDGEVVDARVGAPPSKQALNEWINDNMGIAPAASVKTPNPKP